MHSQGVDGWSAVGQLWGVLPAPSKGPRARYTVRDVAQMGVALADRHGLPGVTLGAVAAHLELTTTALYRYVDSKDTLVELMVDVAAGPPPEPAGTWREQLREWCSALMQVYLAHPWLSDVKPTQTPRCPNGLAWYHHAHAALLAGNVSDAGNALLHLNLLIRGYAEVQHSLRRNTTVPDWFAAAVNDTFPQLVAQPAPTRDDILSGFRAATNWLLATLPETDGRR